MRIVLWIMLFCVLAGCEPYMKKAVVNLIPQPQEVIVKRGNFKMNKSTTITYSDPGLEKIAEYLKKMLKQDTGIEVGIKEGDVQKNTIVLKLREDKNGKDVYWLNISKTHIEIEATTPRGLILAVQTMRQLIPPAEQAREKVKFPVLAITDSPYWEWRGMMMDVSRHFFDMDEVKQFLDLMAYYKLNKFHWHLTNDQGWRIEIKKYPLLTQKGAWRTFNKHDRSCMNLAKKESNPDYNLPEDKLRHRGDTVEYGGFFTQDEIREIVDYAAERGIDVIPEIDMPGHFSAAIACYPELACFNKTGWGTTFSDPICPGKDATIDFCKDVFLEVFELFPFEYVHLGADEVEKNTWMKCPNCQKRIRDHQLKDEKELQAWFVKEMEAFFHEHGKKLIGWDEIIDGGLPERATVMWWRTWARNAVQTAVGQGNEVILAPNSHYYFDYKQDYSTFRKLYDFEPYPKKLSAEQMALIKGLQANSWAEYIPSMKRLQYLTVPRILVLSERAWHGTELLPWEHFEKRLPEHFARFDVWKINYRPLDITGIHTVNAFVGETKVKWNNPLGTGIIRYTTDGSVPDEHSAQYTRPFKIDTTTSFTIRYFRPDGSGADIVKTLYRKDVYRIGLGSDDEQPGLKCVWHEAVVNRCSHIDTIPVKQEYVVDGVKVPAGVGGKRALVYTGMLEVDKDDVYTFSLSSDDGSMLYIHDEVVVDNDGPHGPVTLTGQIALGKGKHPLKLYYFDMNNGGFVELKLWDSSGEEIVLNNGVLSH